MSNALLLVAILLAGLTFGWALMPERKDGGRR